MSILYLVFKITVNTRTFTRIVAATKFLAAFSTFTSWMTGLAGSCSSLISRTARSRAIAPVWPVVPNNFVLAKKWSYLIALAQNTREFSRHTPYHKFCHTWLHSTMMLVTYSQYMFLSAFLYPTIQLASSCAGASSSATRFATCSPRPPCVPGWVFII